MAKVMDKLNCSVIELPKLSESKGDELLVKTLASSLKNSALSISAGLTKSDVDRAYSCIKKAAKPILIIPVPVSAVQMEYICRMKGPKALELITELVSYASGLGADTEFSAQDATRAEFDFLCEAVKTAVNAGAKRITLCDTAGVMLPDDAATFVKKIRVAVPEVEKVTLAVEFTDQLDMSTACAFAAASAGADEIKTTINEAGYPQIENVVKAIDKKGEAFSLTTDVVKTELNRSIKQMKRLSGHGECFGVVRQSEEKYSSASFSAKDDIDTIKEACARIGYELSEEDLANVYEAFTRVATKKETVSEKELEAIIASSALQVPATYKLISYVINSGNIITATANIKLQNGENEVLGISAGDGPIDAAFKAIDQILGHHCELDDFQIQSVTEGREAMGRAIVKLRANGTLYSGTGISTDIIGASVHAYVNAINKMVYSEQ